MIFILAAARSELPTIIRGKDRVTPLQQWADNFLCLLVPLFRRNNLRPGVAGRNSTGGAPTRGAV